MLQNYFKLALRNLLANKLVSGINIFGLSIAIGCCITAFLFLQNYWTIDRFHLNGGQIFIVEYVTENNEAEEAWGTAPMPLAEALATDFPQVERVVRVEVLGGKAYLGDRVFEEAVYFADPGFFDMFTFPLASGDPGALSEPDAIILSTEAAEKYFKGEDALGKELTIAFVNQVRKVFTVKGVAEPFPHNAGFRFDILAGFNSLKAIGTEGLTDWATHTWGTFVQLHRPEDIGYLQKNMEPYVALQNAANEDMKVKRFQFDNLRHPNPEAYKVYQRPAEAAHPLLTLMFSLMALLMMALSCFNYINISLGLAGKRLKEIGLRKAIGGRKMQLVWQFLSENILLCFLALALGVVLTQVAFAPLLNSIMVMQISPSLNDNLWLWVFLAGLLAFTGVASGAYPAFYVSSFEPVAIFRGRQQLGEKKGLTQLLLALQFVLAFSTVIIGMVLITAGRYWQGQPWGYQPEQALVVRLDEAGQYAKLKNAAEHMPFTLGVAGAATHIGESVLRTSVFIGNEQYEVMHYDVGAGYFEALGLRLMAGRFFDPLRQEENKREVVVNETFVKERQWKDAIGQEIRSEGKAYTVVGVAEDFKIMGSGATRPVIFNHADEKAFAYLAIRHEPGVGKQVETGMETAWKRLYPELPFNYFHQDAVFDSFYESYGSVSTAFSYLAGLALLIACMGLFGLASQNYASRLKEISIRKVLGASTRNIILLVNRGFLLMLGAACLIATTLCYLGIQLLVNSVDEFTGAMNLGFTPYLLANLLAFFAAALAVGGQTYQLAKAAPADSLRVE
ncbi:MAG: ABC transporter permease [Lewinellaceae bacterium]|nr:ABC transporter permease [Lewinellaceae bacterium]